MRYHKPLLNGAAFLLLMLAPALAGAHRHGRVHDVCCQGGYAYDVRSEVTLSGTIETMTYHETTLGWRGVHLTLRSNEVLFEVRLGPDFYVEASKLELTVGDEIEVTGSRLSEDSKDFLVAGKVKKGSYTLVLRDDSGRPLWTRSRRPAT